MPFSYGQERDTISGGIQPFRDVSFQYLDIREPIREHQGGLFAISRSEAQDKED